jgi:hypothetical protein
MRQMNEEDVRTGNTNKRGWKNLSDLIAIRTRRSPDAGQTSAD